MIVGFTGTREGMTDAQLATVRRVLESIDIGELHHGDCVGADAQVDPIARECGAYIAIHPPTDPKLRARCDGPNTTIHPDRDYIARNRKLVDSVDLLIAAPDGPERQRSGTWSTVRYARKTWRPVVLVRPDGTYTLLLRKGEM